MTALTTAKILACCALSYLCVTAGIVVWRAGNALDANLAKWGDGGAQAFAGLNAALDNLNRPCSPGPCGLLPNGTKTETKIGDAIVQTQLVERATTPHVTAAMDQFGMAAQHLSGTADSLKGTADALTGTARGATATLAESQRTIAAAQPLLAQLTANGASLQATTDTLNDVLKRQAIGKLLDNAAGISGDFRTIADKATADFIRPVPWWQQPIKKGSQIIDITAAIARHTP